MTKDDILTMASEAYCWHVNLSGDRAASIARLQRFAELVAAHERNRTWTQNHWTEYERSIAAAEREACAKVCEDIARLYSTDIFPENGTSIDCNSAKMGRVVTKNCAQSIRARGQHD